MDGFLDVWDFFYRQNEVAYSQKISDSPLTSINVHGSMAAIGDADGTVSIMGLCRPLYDQTLQPKEKELMQQIFEREFRREKMLEQQKRQAEKGKKPKKEAGGDVDKKEAEKKAKLEKIDEDFFKVVADGDQAMLSEIKARGDGAGDHPEAAAVTAEPAAAAEDSPVKKQLVELSPGDYSFAIHITPEAGDK
jgi:dynein intermediate chain 2